MPMAAGSRRSRWRSSTWPKASAGPGSRLVDVCAGLDETNLSKDEKGYLRLYALYRAIDASKDGRAPAELRAQADDFRFDQTLVSSWLKQRFPLKKVEASRPPPAAHDAAAGVWGDLGLRIVSSPGPAGVTNEG
jgi:hypothetical protein